MLGTLRNAFFILMLAVGFAFLITLGIALVKAVKQETRKFPPKHW